MTQTDIIVEELEVHMKKYGGAINRTHRLQVGAITNVVVVVLSTLGGGCDEICIDKNKMRQDILTHVRNKQGDQDASDITVLSGNGDVHVSCMPHN